MRTLTAIAVLALLLAAGCAAAPYEYGRGIEDESTLRLKPDEPQFTYGEPDEALDWIGNYIFGLPGKLLLWDWRVDNHDISDETEDLLRRYLAENDLRHVKVRLNDWDPTDEWDRLKRNQAIHPGWKYTFGAVTVLFYTILPGRIFGGDNFNPYTNTINIYSDHPSIVLHEAGHAKDFAQREWKGAYASLRILPLVPLWQEAIATGDAIGYDREKRRPDREKEDYKTLYPAYTTYIVGEGLNWVDTGYGFLIQLAVSVPANIVGRIRASFVDDEEE